MSEEKKAPRYINKPYGNLTLYANNAPIVTFEHDGTRVLRDGFNSVDQIVAAFWGYFPSQDATLTFPSWEGEGEKHVIFSSEGVRFGDGYAPNQETLSLWQAIAAGRPAK